MSVEVTYSLADMFGAILHGWRRLLRILLVLELLWIALFVGADLVAGVDLGLALAWIDWELLGILGVLAAAAWFGLCPLLAFYRTKRAGLLGPNRFTLVDKGIRVETAKADSTVYWPAIKRTVRTPTRFYLYLVTAGAIIIPRRAFESDAGFKGFADQATQTWSRERQA